jgi:hypothetical protein
MTQDNHCTPETSTQQPLRTTQSPFDYAEAWHWLEEKGRSVYGKEFRLHAEDAPIINTLICYFLNDQISAPFHGINLEKGLIISGPVGCGKTSLMNLFRFVAQPGRQYAMKPCREVSFEFIRDGYEVIHRYTRGRAGKFEMQAFCFDDLGVEKNIKYYGNECNVMAEIILSRYDLFVSRKMLTHITTNLSASEIEKAYGNRIRSRLREMFNVVAFETGAKDKRR